MSKDKEYLLKKRRYTGRALIIICSFCILNAVIIILLMRYFERLVALGLIFPIFLLVLTSVLLSILALCGEFHLRKEEKMNLAVGESKR